MKSLVLTSLFFALVAAAGSTMADEAADEPEMAENTR